MCFCKTKESKILVAKRDITVYKVGCFADEFMFYPYFRATYMYCRKTSMYECVDFDRNFIDIVLYNYVYVGKFIIPKGSTYMVNYYNEVVSNTLVYTGKFKHINKNEAFNVKELWKEN